jgi:uncharacterized membrane protein YgcG
MIFDLIFNLYIKKHLFILFLSLLFGSHLAASHPEEYIENFKCEIHLQTNGKIHVSEEIIVNSQDIDIQRGIVRLIPTKPKTSYRFSDTIDLKILEVYRNGSKEDYRIVNNKLGIEIHIGSNKKIEKGWHTFKIIYEADRVIRGSYGYDELYWNVTGSSWDFPIANAQAVVHLPFGANPLKKHAYTGRYGETKKGYQLDQHENVLNFKTTKPLQKKAGLTIYVSWPKGYVTSYVPNSTFTFINHIALHIFLAPLFIILLINFYYIRKIKKITKSKTFNKRKFSKNPPENLSPAEISYLYHMEFKIEALISTILDLHIRGYIVISKESDKHFKISKNYSELIGLSNRELFLLNELFKESNAITIDEKNRTELKKVLKYFNYHLKIHFKTKFTNFQRQKNQLEIFVLAVFSPFIIYSELPVPYIYTIFFSIFYFKFCKAYLSHLFKCPNNNFEQLYEKIESFRNFLLLLKESPEILEGSQYHFTTAELKKYIPYMVGLQIIEDWDIDLVNSLKECLSNEKMHLFFHRGISCRGHGFNSEFSSSVIGTGSGGGFSGGGFGGGFSGGGFGGGGGCGR